MAERLRELVVVSGKGGTGKTSVTASFASLSDSAVIADCDVDAADLHVVLSPRVLSHHEFYSGMEARIRPESCLGCGVCVDACRFEAISAADDEPSLAHGHHPQAPSHFASMARMEIDPFACEGCGVCRLVCPNGAIDLAECRCGSWMISETRCGPMVHARLSIGGENSGKLVSIVRREARRVARESGRDTVLVDGPPGIGCPAIASITGASSLLAVTEPTVSGAHDLLRVLSLARHFGTRAFVCVNRWDVNPGMSESIEAEAARAGAAVTSRIRYDPSVARAQLEAKTVVEMKAPAADDIRRVWEDLNGYERTNAYGGGRTVHPDDSRSCGASAQLRPHGGPGWPCHPDRSLWRDGGVLAQSARRPSPEGALHDGWMRLGPGLREHPDHPGRGAKPRKRRLRAIRDPPGPRRSSGRVRSLRALGVQCLGESVRGRPREDEIPHATGQPHGRAARLHAIFPWCEGNRRVRAAADHPERSARARALHPLRPE